jgi:hypothetical protein
MCRVFALIQVPRCCSTTSTFVPNNCSQHVCCVLPIIRCTFGAHLDVGLAERSTPCRCSRFLSSFYGEMATFDKIEPLMPQRYGEFLWILRPKTFSFIRGRLCAAALRVESSFKTDSGYPKHARDTTPLQALRSPSALSLNFYWNP